MEEDRGIWEPNQYERFTELWELLKAYPELPIIPMVYGGVVGEGDSSCDWLGGWGHSNVDEYVKTRRYNKYDYGSVLLKSDNDIYNTLEKYLLPFEFDALPESEDGCREIYESLPWKRAIIVHIVMPKGD